MSICHVTSNKFPAMNYQQNPTESLKKTLPQPTASNKLPLSRELVENLKAEKINLIDLNEKLKKKLKYAKRNSSTKRADLARENREKSELFETVEDLSRIVEKFKSNDTFEIERRESPIANFLDFLEEKAHRNDEESPIIPTKNLDVHKLLESQLSDARRALEDVETENSLLKRKNRQLREDLDTYKRQLDETIEQSDVANRNRYVLEEDKRKLEFAVSELRMEKTKMADETAGKISIDTELALRNISDAYERKSKEVERLMEQLIRAENIIEQFRQQLISAYK
ncbi:unnamed protein product [Phyllotreta striolata]|uniref:Uncharacterized protein n=1 Tax=Phyllotreta striolata TaxID=444603 RepID=A0A9N9XVX1_PHYSR|nr:unnamed protein product [Phyllotreta striolata]